MIDEYSPKRLIKGSDKTIESPSIRKLKLSIPQNTKQAFKKNKSSSKRVVKQEYLFDSKNSSIKSINNNYSNFVQSPDGHKMINHSSRVAITNSGFQVLAELQKEQEFLKELKDDYKEDINNCTEQIDFQFSDIRKQLEVQKKNKEQRIKDNLQYEQDPDRIKIVKGFGGKLVYQMPNKLKRMTTRDKSQMKKLISKNQRTQLNTDTDEIQKGSMPEEQTIMELKRFKSINKKKILKKKKTNTSIQYGKLSSTIDHTELYQEKIKKDHMLETRLTDSANFVSDLGDDSNSNIDNNSRREKSKSKIINQDSTYRRSLSKIPSQTNKGSMAHLAYSGETFLSSIEETKHNEDTVDLDFNDVEFYKANHLDINALRRLSCLMGYNFGESKLKANIHNNVIQEDSQDDQNISHESHDVGVFDKRLKWTSTDPFKEFKNKSNRCLTLNDIEQGQNCHKKSLGIPDLSEKLLEKRIDYYQTQQVEGKHDQVSNGTCLKLKSLQSNNIAGHPNIKSLKGPISISKDKNFISTSSYKHSVHYKCQTKMDENHGNENFDDRIILSPTHNKSGLKVNNITLSDWKLARKESLVINKGKIADKLNKGDVKDMFVPNKIISNFRIKIPTNTIQHESTPDNYQSNRSDRNPSPVHNQHSRQLKLMTENSQPPPTHKHEQKISANEPMVKSNYTSKKKLKVLASNENWDQDSFDVKDKQLKEKMGTVDKKLKTLKQNFDSSIQTKQINCHENLGENENLSQTSLDKELETDNDNKGFNDKDFKARIMKTLEQKGIGKPTKVQSKFPKKIIDFTTLGEQINTIKNIREEGQTSHTVRDISYGKRDKYFCKTIQDLASNNRIKTECNINDTVNNSTIIKFTKIKNLVSNSSSQIPKLSLTNIKPLVKDSYQLPKAKTHRNVSSSSNGRVYSIDKPMSRSHIRQSFVANRSVQALPIFPNETSINKQQQPMQIQDKLLARKVTAPDIKRIRDQSKGKLEGYLNAINKMSNLTTNTTIMRKG